MKRGEGWIGYRKSKASNTELIPSKFLYFAFYQGSAQKFVNSKTNGAEEAYRQLLEARRATSEGVRLLPSEVSRIRYEDLRAILLDYYREHKPYWIIKRYAGDIDSAGSKPRKGFLDLPQFNTLRDAMPEKLRPKLTFLYFSECRSVDC